MLSNVAAKTSFPNLFPPCRLLAGPSNVYIKIFIVSYIFNKLFLVDKFHLVVYVKCLIWYRHSVPPALWQSVSPCAKSKYGWVRLKLTEAQIRNTLRGFAPYLAAGKPWTPSNSATPIEFLKWFCSMVPCDGRVSGQRAGFARIGWFHHTKVSYWFGQNGEMNILTPRR